MPYSVRHRHRTSSAGTLPLRTDDSRAMLFATYGYVLWAVCIGLGSHCLRWAEVISVGRYALDTDEILFRAATSGLGYGLLIWLGHRFVAACVFRYWRFRKALPDYGFMAKVVCYENVGFVLAVVLCAMLYVPISFARYFLWRGPAGMNVGGFWVSGPPMRHVICGAVLSLIAFWRYRLILRAIRWSNF